jgi:serine/threonine protein kinase
MSAASNPSPSVALTGVEPVGLLFQPETILDNNYRIVRALATGGMGEVYLAVHLRLPRTLAIKVLQREFAARPEWVSRFCREACILAQLHHPNIVQVVDFNVTEGGTPYLVMELIEGKDLSNELVRGRRFEGTEILSIVRQVASALGVAHAAGVVHRDLKPENVVLCPAPGQMPVVKVIDFGMSLCGWGERVTGDCSVFGTPDYMAPEQAEGRRDDMDARTDQFALAALTYTLLSMRTPFGGDTAVSVLYNIVHSEPAPLLVEGWDGTAVEAVLRKGMARSRDDRYGSVLDFADAIETALIEGGALSIPSTAEGTPPMRLISNSPSSQTRSDSKTGSRTDSRTDSKAGSKTDLVRSSTRIIKPRSKPMLALSFGLLVAGAVWGGMRVSPHRSTSLHDDVGAVRELMSSQLTRLAGQVRPAATQVPVAERTTP